ncbi:MAG: hypothetical protein H6727_10605 [Myxococcales bacterium]|nr:hypothetical protein [Myxococcales bacterium]
MDPLEALLSLLPTSLVHLFACECAEHILIHSTLQTSARKKAFAAISAKRAWVEGRIKDERLQQAHREVWQAAQQIQAAIQLMQGAGSSLAKRSGAWPFVGVMWSAAWASHGNESSALEVAVNAAYNAASASGDASAERAWQIECAQRLRLQLEEGRAGLVGQLVRRWRFLKEKAPQWQEELETALFS